MTGADNSPQFNTNDFTCPGCLSRFKAGTMRVAKRDGIWHCRRCAFGLSKTTGSAGTPAETFVTRAQTPLEHLESENCANCHREFGHRRIITRADGTRVHYRCPTVSRSMRKAAQRAPS